MTDGYCGKYLFNDTLQLEYDGLSWNEVDGITMGTKPSREFFCYPKRGWFRVSLDVYFKHFWNNSVANGMIQKLREQHTLRTVLNEMR